MKKAGFVIGILIGLVIVPFIDLIPVWILLSAIAATGLLTCLVMSPGASLSSAVGIAIGCTIMDLLGKYESLASGEQAWHLIAREMLGNLALISLTALAGTLLAICLQALGRLVSKKA